MQPDNAGCSTLPVMISNKKLFIRLIALSILCSCALLTVFQSDANSKSGQKLKPRLRTQLTYPSSPSYRHTDGIQVNDDGERLLSNEVRLESATRPLSFQS